MRGLPSRVSEPPLDHLAQHRQGDRSVLQHAIVECPLVETCAKSFLGLIPQPADLQLTDLVRETLAGPSNPPINIDRRLPRRSRRVSELVVDRLLSSPSLRVHSRFQHECRALVDLVLEPAQSLRV